MNATGKNQIPCGSIRNPCSSISFAINNVSSHNDTICLIASPIKRIRYTAENTVVIKHSLAITKYPTYSQNPLITYDLNVTRNRKEFYAFAIFRDARAPNILTLNIKSVNLYINILTTSSGGFKTFQKNVVAKATSGFQLRLSISDSIVSSTSHPFNFSDISEYDNFTIHMKDLVIKSGDFMFMSRKERCEPLEHIKDIIEMNNVTICNTENVTLSVHGCFNMSIEKLTCSNITWMKQDFFTFAGGVLNVKNVLIKNFLANNNVKYNKSDRKPLFIINESVALIRNILIKDSVGLSSIRQERFSAVLMVQNSVVQIVNMKMVGNLLRNFLQANKSSLSFKNMTLVENNITARLCRVEESNVTLYEIKFYRNKIGCIVSINLKSKVLITNNTLIENDIFQNAYSISRSLMKVNNTNFRGNKITSLTLAESQSFIYLDIVIFTNNHVSFDVFNIYADSKLKMYNAEFRQNNLYTLLYLASSNFIIQNNTMIENNVSWVVYYITKNSSIKLNHVAFTRNKLECYLLIIASNSSAIIQNNTMIENNVSWAVYFVIKNSKIQLMNLTFIQNRLNKNFLVMVWSSSAKLINNRIVGNSLHRMFFAQSCFLEIDTIFIKNNTLSQLIRVLACKFSFELMKIREHNVKDDMIYSENSAGTMANTYIKNSDNFLVSAITSTCTYLEKSNYSFEITNAEIVWNSEVLVSTRPARPVIQLCGYVVLSNVKLLVTSILKTEILQYSTKEVTVSENGFVETFINKNIFSSLFIGCTKASVKHITKADTFQCAPCERGTYTLNNGSLNISISIQSKTNTQHESTNITCLDCPIGSNRSASIKSKSNFYGYQTKEQKLKFLPCPKGFCCTGNQCHTVDSCNKNRIGTLCGRCIEDYVENYLSTDCISINSCQNLSKFWLVYCISALILATLLYYMKDFITLIKTTVGNFSNIFKLCKKEKECDDKIDMIVLVGSEEDSEKTSHFTVSGIFTLIVSFYQIKQLINVNVQYKKSTDFYFITFITDCLNLEMVAVTFSSLCPMSNLDSVSKAFIKTYLLTGTLIIACLINYFLSAVFHFFRSSLGRLSSLKPSDRFGVCFIRVLMLSYKNIASALLLLLNCVEVADNKVLFIKGDMTCYQWWQIVIAVFFFTWILLFPLSLKVSFNMFMKDKISFAKFILYLIVPFAVVINYRLNRNIVSVDLQKSRNTDKVKEILREMFQEPYRLKADDPSGETVFYETWRLYQRVFLAIVATFWIDPLKRITLMTPIVFLIAISYHVIKPYKPEMYILHWIEVFSILGIFVCIAHNMFRGILYIYDIDDEDSSPVNFVRQTFAIFDLAFSPICVLIYFFIIAPICKKVKCKFISFYMTIRKE